jgi:hypothetical protein
VVDEGKEGDNVFRKSEEKASRCVADEAACVHRQHGEVHIPQYTDGESTATIVINSINTRSRHSPIIRVRSRVTPILGSLLPRAASLAPTPLPPSLMGFQKKKAKIRSYHIYMANARIELTTKPPHHTVSSREPCPAAHPGVT